MDDLLKPNMIGLYIVLAFLIGLAILMIISDEQK